MIINLFSYPSNFGKLQIYKCDFFGNALSTIRPCLADNFTVNVEQKDIEDRLLFGEFNQPDYFLLNSRKINITVNFLFSLDMTYIIDPAVDLLFNASAWSYQGTSAPYKVSINTITDTQLIYNELLPFQALNITTTTLPMFKFYLVNETQSEQINPTSINTTAAILTYESTTPPTNCWLEVFQYGNIVSLDPYSIYYEPMFRLDCSEGSFFPCMVNKISFNIEEDYIRLECQIVSINYDRSTRFNFINAASPNSQTPQIIPLHRSRIKILDYINDITSDFNVTDLTTLEYMNSLITQSFASTPIKRLSINIDNGLQPIYSNINSLMKRTYVSGYYSQRRKINGTLDIFALRSSQPTFDKYPILNSQNNKAMSVYFGNQIFTLPYTIWTPGKVTLMQNEYATVQFNWEAITRNRQGQPCFQMQ